MDDREIWVRFAAAALPVAHDTWTPSLGYSPTAIAAGTADALLAEYRNRYPAPERDVEIPINIDVVGIAPQAIHPEPADTHVVGSTHLARVLVRRGHPVRVVLGRGREVVVAIDPQAGGSSCTPCPGCAGESGGSDG